MAGSAFLDPDVLVDDLVPLIDELRGDLHPEFGVRAYRVFACKRVSSGRFPGEGKASIVDVGEILPQPRVWTWDGLRWGLEACGLNEMGEIKLTEISLTYTDADLTGGDLPGNVQWMFRLEEAHGQGTPPRFFVHVRPPFIDREKDMGWVAWLKFVNLPSGAP